MTQELILNVPKMSCEKCVANITKGLENAGITGAQFDIANKTVKITGTDLNERDVLKTLRRIDYPASVI